MSEDFLSRWSRRKQAAQAAVPAKPLPDPEGPAGREPAAGPGAPEARDTSGTSPSAADAARDAGAFDPASLPAIGSITAETDIRAFFAAGVPAELTRAALRRVWSTDPKIRDFVGLADYDWDFNAPGSMAGFGPLGEADALRAQAARWVGPVRTEDGPDATSGHAAGANQEALDAKPEALASDDSVHERPDQPTEITSADERPQEIGASQGDEHAAAQQQQEKPEDVQSIARRKHGRALPDS